MTGALEGALHEQQLYWVSADGGGVELGEASPLWLCPWQ